MFENESFIRFELIKLLLESGVHINAVQKEATLLLEWILDNSPQ